MSARARDRFRVAHFGDLHLDDFDEEYDWVLHMAERAEEEGADHLVFTGDIVDAGQVEIVESLLDDLRDMGLGPSRVSFVPGNHDVYPLRWPLQAKDLLKTISGDSQDNWERLERLSRRQHGRRSGELLGDGFPWVKRLAPDVVLVGMDSTRSGTKKPWRWAEGQLDEDEVDAAADHLEGFGGVAHKVVLMHHYPFNDFDTVSEHVPMHFAEPDAATARSWLKWMGATSILCGHIHDHRERRIAGGIRVFTTDSSINDAGDGRAFRLLTFGPGKRVTSRIVDVDVDEDEDDDDDDADDDE